MDPRYATEVWNRLTVASGTVRLGGTGTAGDCTLTIPRATYPLTPSAADTFDLRPSGDHYLVWLTFPDGQSPEMQIACPDRTTSGPYPIPDFKLIFTLNPHESTGQGSFAGDDSYNGSNYRWSLAAR